MQPVGVPNQGKLCALHSEPSGAQAPHSGMYSEHVAARYTDTCGSGGIPDFKRSPNPGILGATRQEGIPEGINGQAPQRGRIEPLSRWYRRVRVEPSLITLGHIEWTRGSFDWVMRSGLLVAIYRGTRSILTIHHRDSLTK